MKASQTSRGNCSISSEYPTRPDPFLNVAQYKPTQTWSGASQIQPIPTQEHCQAVKWNQRTFLRYYSATISHKGKKHQQEDQPAEEKQYSTKQPVKAQALCALKTRFFKCIT